MKPVTPGCIARTRLVGLALIAALSLGACGEDKASGQLELDLAGAIRPGMARQAWVEVSGVTVEHADGTRIQIGFEPRHRVDLMALGRGQSEALLREAELPAGRYEWLQLHLNTRGREDTYLVTSGDAGHELVIPAGQRDPLRIVTPFHVEPGAATRRTIVFGLREPLDEAGPTTGSYALKPTLRMVDTASAAHITATAARPFLEQQCPAPHDAGVALYVFPGTEVVPDDRDEAGAEPIAVAAGTGEDDDTPLAFRASFLDPGQYTIALTCNAGHDRPEADDRLAFFGAEGIRLVAGRTVNHAF